MYTYRRQIHLKETDATGALFFTEQLNLALEALESYFLSVGFTLQQMLDREHFAMPIVHAETDFLSPLRVGDEVVVELLCEKLGTTSFTVISQVKNAKGQLVGTTKIVHVCISLRTEKSIPLPEVVSAHLREL